MKSLLVITIAAICCSNAIYCQQYAYNVPKDYNTNVVRVSDHNKAGASVQEIPVNIGFSGYNDQRPVRPRPRPRPLRRVPVSSPSSLTVTEVDEDSASSGYQPSVVKPQPPSFKPANDEVPSSVYSGVRKPYPVQSQPTYQYDISYKQPAIKYKNGALCKFLTDCESGCCVEHAKYNRTCQPLALEGQTCSLGQIKGGYYDKFCPCASGQLCYTGTCPSISTNKQH